MNGLVPAERGGDPAKAAIDGQAAPHPLGPQDGQLTQEEQDEKHREVGEVQRSLWNEDSRCEWGSIAAAAAHTGSWG